MLHAAASKNSERERALDDRIDAVTVTRNTLYGHGNLNLRMTGVYAWDQISRNSPIAGNPNRLGGLFPDASLSSAGLPHGPENPSRPPRFFQGRSPGHGPGILCSDALMPRLGPTPPRSAAR